MDNSKKNDWKDVVLTLGGIEISVKPIQYDTSFIYVLYDENHAIELGINLNPETVLKSFGFEIIESGILHVAPKLEDLGFMPDKGKVDQGYNRIQIFKLKKPKIELPSFVHLIDFNPSLNTFSIKRKS